MTRYSFQSTPSHGGRHRRTIFIIFACRFQSTPSHGGRRYTDAPAREVMEFQSTPSHGGRLFFQCVCTFFLCFNPRPHMEGDLLFAVSLRCYTLFQSTPSHGGRQRLPTLKSLNLLVSIHALTWRATFVPFVLRIQLRCFNPRPHMEGDSC